ncbi:MAG: hypothetical protein FWG65_13435 [Turicibacter sp.]|nr:hypothetical protein [Turicibacter sp.]
MIIIITTATGGSFFLGLLLAIGFVLCCIVVPFVAVFNEDGYIGTGMQVIGVIASIAAFALFLIIFNDFYVVREVLINPYTGRPFTWANMPSGSPASWEFFERAGGVTRQPRVLPLLSPFWSFVVSLVLLAATSYSRTALGLSHKFHYVFLTASVLILFVLRNVFGV